MIYDHIDSWERYSGLGAAFAMAFTWLNARDLTALEPGRTDIDGDDVYALVQDYAAKSLAETKWEAHRKYADIQYLVTGEEIIAWAPLQACSVREYIAEKDFVSLDVDSWIDIPMRAGYWAVFFPQDAHRPGFSRIPGGPVRKIVVKVRIDA